MIKEKIYTQFKEYLNYLLVNSTVEAPLWNKEVLIGIKKPGWTYIDGCMMVALIAYYKATGDKEILNYVDNFIDKLVDDNGHVTIYYYDNYNNYTTNGCDSDPCNMAKVLYTLYDETKKEKYRKAIDFFMDNQVRKLPRIRGNFWHKIKYYNQIWLDGLYMIQPFFAEYSKRYNNEEDYYDIVYQLENAFNLTWEEDKKLMVHGYDGQYLDPNKKMIWSNPENGHSPIVWLRACGWYEMALVDVLEIIEDEVLKQNITTLIQKTIDGLLQYLDKNSSMFYQIPNMPNEKGNYLETSGTLMIAYSILKAVRLNALPQKYQEIGLNILYKTCDKYLVKDSNGIYKFGGICIGAGLTASRTDKYAGTYDMYITRKIVDDDGKGIGPLILAFAEVLLINR